jgi:hypothetical protein
VLRRTTILQLVFVLFTIHLRRDQPYSVNAAIDTKFHVTVRSQHVGRPQEKNNEKFCASEGGIIASIRKRVHCKTLNERAKKSNFMLQLIFTLSCFRDYSFNFSSLYGYVHVVLKSGGFKLLGVYYNERYFRNGLSK